MLMLVTTSKALVTSSDALVPSSISFVPPLRSSCLNAKTAKPSTDLCSRIELVFTSVIFDTSRSLSWS